VSCWTGALRGQRPLGWCVIAARWSSRWSAQVVGLFGGAGGGEVGAAGLHDGLELHELDAGAVGIVEVGLPFAVFAHLGAVVAGWEAVLGVEGGDGGFHVGDAEGEVVEDAEFAGVDVIERGGGAVADHHVLDPVVAVGDLLGDPVDVVGLHGAEPVGAEAEDVVEEAVFGGLVVDEEADVDDAGGDGLGAGGEGDRLARFDELNFVAFGILGLEPVALVGGGLEVGDFDAFRLEVGVEGFGFGGVEGDAGDAAEGGLLVGRERQDFDELGGAEVEAVSGRILGIIGFEGTKNLAVEI